MSTRTETPSEFAMRMGVPLKTLSRKLRHPKCPQNFIADEGPSGRFKSIQASPELEHFIRTDPRRFSTAQLINSSTAQNL